MLLSRDCWSAGLRFIRRMMFSRYRFTAKTWGSESARRLLQFNFHTVEFVWIMSKYGGCRRENIEQLIRTPAIRRHIGKYQLRIDESLKEFPPPPEPAGG
jgi:hypothetical protein